MKARIKKTGEIVDILRFSANGSYTVYRDSLGMEHGENINYYTDFEEINLILNVTLIIPRIKLKDNNQNYLV